MNGATAERHVSRRQLYVMFAKGISAGIRFATHT